MRVLAKGSNESFDILQWFTVLPTYNLVVRQGVPLDFMRSVHETLIQGKTTRSKICKTHALAHFLQGRWSSCRVPWWFGDLRHCSGLA